MTQIIKHSNTIFKDGWITSGSGDLWNCHNTYCIIPRENLPQASRATNDLAWLNSANLELSKVINAHSTLQSAGENQIANLGNILARSQHLGLNLPEPFVHFLQSEDLQAQVPTCTDCYLELSDDFIPVLGLDGNFLLRFLSDSQSCFMWYLWLGPGASVRVVASSFFFEPDLFKALKHEDEELKYEDIFREAFLCADTFTEFLYRFWVENSIWLSNYKKLALTPIQQEYRDQIIKKL